jgi:hypothetical protein
MQNCGHLQLCENRRGEGVTTGFAEDPPDPTLQQRKDEDKKRNAEIAKLNKMSTMVKDEIYANLWATKYWEYLIDRLFSRDPVLIEFSQTERSPPSESTTGASNSSTQRPSPQGNYNNKVEGAFLIEVAYGLQRDVLQRRYLDAREIARPIWEGMGRTINRLIEGESKSFDGLAGKHALTVPPDILGDPSEDEFAFRAFHKDKQAKFFEIQGDMHCGNWHNFDISNSFVRQEADDHVSGLHVGPTNYISIMTSPKRLWNIMKKFDQGKNAIAIIDLRVLKRLGIPYGSTKGNGRSELGLYGKGFATEEELLVAGWIPSQAIKGFLSYKQFKDLLTKNGIENSDSCVSSLVAAIFESTCS